MNKAQLSSSHMLSLWLRRSALVGALLLAPFARADSSSFSSGQWLLVQYTIAETKVPLLKDVRAETTMTFLYDLKEANGRISGTGKVCGLNIESHSKVVQMHFPPQFIRALSAPPINARYSCAEGACKLDQPTQYTIVGTKLSKPRTESLPTKKEDPRVIDQDGDGQPGMTVNITGWVDGDVHIVQRNTAKWKASTAGSGFEGKVAVTTEQNIVSATRFLLKKETNPEPRDEESWLRLEPFSKKSCKDANLRANSLVKNRPR